MNRQQQQAYPLLQQPQAVAPVQQAPSQNAVMDPGTNATQRATSKAGAYGGSELGSLVGGAVGPPIIGGIVGNLVGERVGEKAVEKSGINRKAGQVRDELAKVVGERNVDKAGEIALTAFGYSNQETCLCCPCMPASQLMLFVMSGFFCFICYRLGLGIYYEGGCTESEREVKILTLDSGEEPEESYSISKIDLATNQTTYLVSYPCEFGFHYMVAGATVWLIFLPWHLFSLLGNCWRQCCCCLCDPLVCCATLWDLFKRYLCECGRFSFIALIWYSMCAFQVVWACLGLWWIVKVYIFREDGNFDLYVDPSDEFKKAVIASVALDIILAGSEIIHKVYFHFHGDEQPPDQQNDSLEMRHVRPTMPQQNTQCV